MPISWLPAKVDGFGVFVVMAGTSTTGKTFTLLRMATGIARARAAEFVGDKRPLAGKILVADTEGGRTRHYANQFDFRVWDVTAPFHPGKFEAGIVDAEAQGAAVLLIDNFSLEWSGNGGVLWMQEEELARRIAADNRHWLSEEQKRFKHLRASWIGPKRPHKLMMQSAIQRRMPILFAIRANLVEKTAADDDDEEPQDKSKKKAKTPPEWKPEQDKRFLYEWTVSFTLHPETPGKPRYDLPFKCEPQHRSLFPEGEFIGEEAGERLWLWANSGARAPGGPASLPAATSKAAGGGELNTGGSPSTSAASGMAKHAPDDTAASVARASSPAAADAGEDFPGDRIARDAAQVAAAKASAFADEAIAELRRQRTAKAVHQMLQHKAWKPKMERLQQGHPAEHQRVVDAAAEHVGNLGEKAA